MERYTETRFGIRDLSKPKHWNSNTSDFYINKPTFINLGGNGTICDSQANGRCSRVERMMGLKAKAKDVSSTYNDVNIISFVYGRDKESDKVGKFTAQEICFYVYTLFLPLFTNEEGERLSLEEACKNFSKIVFYSHCYGSVALNEMLSQLNKSLIELGYSKDEVLTIYSHSIHITYSPLQADSWLPCVAVNSFSDSYNQASDMRVWFKRTYGYDLNGVALDFGDKYFCKHLINKKECHKTISIYTSRLLNTEDNTGSKIIDEHASDYLDLDYSWSACEKSKGAKNSECVSKLVGYALSWAGARAIQVEKSDKNIDFKLEDLMLSLKDVLNMYNENDLRYEEGL